MAPSTTGNRRAWVRIAILVLCVSLLVWTVARLGPARVLAAARQADAWWLALSLVPIAGRFLIWGLKWQLMLRRQGPAGFRFALQTVLAGAFVNLTTPTAKLAGGIVRARLIHRRLGWSMPVSLGWSLADQVTNFLGHLALVGLLGLGTALVLPPGTLGRSFGVAGATALAVVAVAWLLLRQGRRLASTPLLARWATRARASTTGGRQADSVPGSWTEGVFGPLLARDRRRGFTLTDLGLAACSFGSLCLANAMVLRALHVETPLPLVLATVAVGYFAGAIVGPMGGIGATEFALIELYTRIGITDTAATAAALLHRACFYVIVLIWGGVSLWRASRSSSGSISPDRPG